MIKKIFTLGVLLALTLPNATFALNPDSLQIHIEIILPDITPPHAISDLEVKSNQEGILELTWTEPGDDGASGTAKKYELRFSTISNINNESDYGNAIVFDQDWTPGEGGSARTEVITGLIPGLTYYWAMKAIDDVNLYSSWSRAPGVNENNFCEVYDATPVPPTGLKALSISTHVVVLAWDDMTTKEGYLDFDKYQLYRSMDLSNWILISSQTTTTYIDEDILTGTTYYYRLKAIDKPPKVLSSQFSPYILVYIPIPIVKELLPIPFPELSLEKIDNRRKITVEFTPLSYYTDLSQAKIKKYIIQHSTDMINWTVLQITTKTTFSDTTDQIKFYRIIPQDQYGNKCPEEKAIVFDNSDSLNLIKSFYEDGKQRVTIKVPQPLHEIIRQRDDILISTYPVQTKYDLAVYEIKLIKYQTQTTKYESPSLDFGSDAIDLTIHYTDSQLQKFNITNEEADKKLAVFYYDGIKWLNLGGVVNKQQKTISVKVSHLSLYALRFSIRADEFVATPTRKIITPTQPGFDVFEILCENPKQAQIKAKIFDLAGAYINDMTHISTPNIDKLIWKGTYKDGKIVPTGVYIWQIELTGTQTAILNGTVVVVR